MRGAWLPEAAHMGRRANVAQQPVDRVGGMVVARKWLQVPQKIRQTWSARISRLDRSAPRLGDGKSTLGAEEGHGAAVALISRLRARGFQGGLRMLDIPPLRRWWAVA